MIIGAGSRLGHLSLDHDQFNNFGPSQFAIVFTYYGFDQLFLIGASGARFAARIIIHPMVGVNLNPIQ